MWALMDGSKTYMGVVVWGMVQLLKMWAPQHMDVWMVMEPLALTLTGVGVGHKLAKVA